MKIAQRKTCSKMKGTVPVHGMPSKRIAVQNWAQGLVRLQLPHLLGGKLENSVSAWHVIQPCGPPAASCNAPASFTLPLARLTQQHLVSVSQSYCEAGQRSGLDCLRISVCRLAAMLRPAWSFDDVVRGLRPENEQTMIELFK